MQALPRRPFGRTGLSVSALGFGGGEIGDPDLPEARVQAVLEAALELGVTLFDTARSYGCSEARFGRWLAPHRDRVVLSTKLGYGVDGVPDWTGAAVTEGVESARRRLDTDVIDIVHLHSCPRAVLEQGEVIDALAEAVAAGKVRVLAYSGENEALQWAAADPRIGALQTSVNIVDQWSARHVLPQARARGLGVIAKRPLANAFWRFAERPVGDYAETYWVRWSTLERDRPALPDHEGLGATALRYAVWHGPVDACITGTSSAEHLRRNAEAVARGPLPEAWVRWLEDAFTRSGSDWAGT